MNPARPPDVDLADLLTDPPGLPGWPESRWRRFLGQGRVEVTAPLALGDPRVHRVVTWATSSRARPETRMGAAAAALAVVDHAVHDSRADPTRLAAELDVAVRAARPLSARRRAQRRVSPSPAMDRHPVPERRRTDPVDTPLVDMAWAVLRRAGLDLRSDPVLAGRLAAALDVAVEHWTAGALPGEGLPSFPSEGLLRSTKRLAVLLGADRDLLPLVYGPQPGRGRPLQVARQRGLAYWVAVTLRADRLGHPQPRLPASVVGHWRTELGRLRAASEPAETPAIDSSDAPTA